MPGKIFEELQQTKPFALAAAEAFVNIERTFEFLMSQFAALLKDRGLSQQQYNVLRILRGARPEGLPCGQIGPRMVSRDPDVTRLTDRLEKAGLAERFRASLDRRVVQVRILGAGLALLAELDEPVNNLYRQQFGILSEEEIIQLISMLERLR